MKKIIIFNDSTEIENLDALHFSSLKEFQAASFSSQDVLGFWIASSYPQDINALLFTLRTSDFWYHLIFTQEEIQNTLADGKGELSLLANKLHKAEESLTKITIALDNFQREEKLLLYLFLRDEEEIVPVFDAESSKLYKYPIIDALNYQQESVGWVTSLISKELLRYNKLIDRVRLCTQCDNAHLYFVDLCPSCASINIQETRVLHCFSCGYVEKESVFRSDSGLSCPKCQNKLRLIGVDYDLPATQYSCSDCTKIFLEPKVTAKCIACGSDNEIQKLNVYEIHSIQASMLGREYLLADQKNIVFSLFSKNLKNIKIEEFKLLLNWMISIYTRRNEFDFSILLLEFTNMQKVIEHYGINRADDLLLELSRRILELMRDTDMLSMKDERLWMLLPITSKKGIEKRLTETINELQSPLDIPISINLKILYTSEKLFSSPKSADSLMQILIDKA